MSRIALSFAFLVGCSDYDLRKQEEPTPDDPADSGSFMPDTSTDTAGVDTGEDTGSEVIPDTADPEVATEPVYINSGSTLYSYDPTTKTATVIGVFKDNGVTVSSMTDIAIDLSGHMFGVAYEELYRITPTTGEVTDLGNIGVNCNALTFVSDGTLVGAGDSGVITIDPKGLKTKKLGGGSFTSSGDIVGLPDGFLYWSVQGGTSDELVQVDPATGKATRLGSIGSSGVYSLGYAYGTLYGFTSGDEVLEIDATTGRTTKTDRLAGSWWGATTNPVLW